MSIWRDARYEQGGHTQKSPRPRADLVKVESWAEANGDIPHGMQALLTHYSAWYFQFISFLFAFTGLRLNYNGWVLLFPGLGQRQSKSLRTTLSCMTTGAMQHYMKGDQLSQTFQGSCLRTGQKLIIWHLMVPQRNNGETLPWHQWQNQNPRIRGFTKHIKFPTSTL